MAIRKQYTEQVSVVITRAMRERIETEAETRDVSMGTVIREIVQAHYAEHDTRVEWTPPSTMQRWVNGADGKAYEMHQDEHGNWSIGPIGEPQWSVTLGSDMSQWESTQDT